MDKPLLDPISLLRELVSINSVNPFQTVSDAGRVYGLGNESEVNSFLAEKLRELGFAVQEQIVEEQRKCLLDNRELVISQRTNVLAEKGDGPRSLLFFAHTDTVDVKTGWQTDPFQLVEEEVNGRTILRALGANDMKGGIAAILSALSGDTQVPDGWKIKVAFLADEEFWSFGAVRLLETNFLDDVALALVPEISEAGGDSDVQWVGLGRLGRSEFIFELTGHACHGADAFVHPRAVNAVHEAAKLEVEVIRYCETVRQEFRAGDISVVNSAYLNLHEGGKGILSVPDRASFVLDRSFVPGESAQEELRKLREVLSKAKEEKRLDLRVEVEVRERSRPTPPCKPYFFPPASAPASFISKAVTRVTDKFEYGIGRSVADENRLAELGIPTFIIAPNGEGSHTCQEWVDKESIYRVRDIFRRVIRQLPDYISSTVEKA